MTKRARKYIPLPERLASALADKLPTPIRDDLRQRRVPAKQIIRLFTPDHIKLHAWGGEDKWFNLDMRLRDHSLKAKDAADTSRAAKAIRIHRVSEEHQRRLLAKNRGEPKPRSRWPSRPFSKGRGFQKRTKETVA